MRLILCLVISLYLAGCATSPFAGLASPPKEPRKLAAYSQTEKQVPLKIGVTPDGKDVIAYATERSYSANASETKEQLSFMQRLGRWIGGLSLMAVIFIVVSLAFFGGAPIIWAVRKYFAMKNAFKNVIKGVEEVSQDNFDKIAPKLEASTDEADRILIKKLKAEL